MHNSDITKDALHAVYSATGSLPGVVSRSKPVMGITGTISLVGGSTELLEECWNLATRCESKWSRFIPSSDISVLNLAEGNPVHVDGLTIRLIQEMKSGAELALGFFDPTQVKSVIDAGYGSSLLDPAQTTLLPDSAAFQGDVAGIVIDGETVTMPIGTVLDPGGIGKGLAGDLVSEFALAEGAWGVMVEFGGDIVVAGKAPDGKAWRIGVENPFGDEQHVDIVRLLSGGVATSSQRKRRFDSQHHLIDPTTHSSAMTTVQTVTVIAASGSRAEVLTKPGFVMPTQDYVEWLPRVGAAGLVIDDNGTITVSSNWARYR